ncbi:MAG: dehydrogenase E1 component subunit alpha/beta [Candidatus Acidiferrum sp.]
MAPQSRIQVAKPVTKIDAPRMCGLSRETLIRLYRTMYLSRKIDDREIQLKRQNRIFFQISSAGHEAVTAAAGLLLRPGEDWVYPYYRDRALCLMLGVTPLEMLLQAVGAKDDPSSGGRQMPSHWGHAKFNIVSRSSCTGTQFLQAVGAAASTLYYEKHPQALNLARNAPLGEHVGYKNGEIVVVSCGEGATSEGEFWESLNAACLQKVPLLYLVEDNGYAISVPVEAQTAGGSISKLARGFPGLQVAECDGTDLLASYAVCQEAIQYCRERRGPALVHAHVTRPYSHSFSDDEKLYKLVEDRQEEEHRDPISQMSQLLLREGFLQQKQLEDLQAEVENEVRQAADAALAADIPSIDSIRENIYSPHIDPQSSAFDSRAHLQGSPKTMVEMVAATLFDEMQRDERVIVFGEDVADASREQNLKHVKGKGGVFKATAGLQRKFGIDRVFNSPIAEASIVGRAMGMAVRGLKPVAEIQFFDYIWPAMMQIRDELCVLRWRSNGAFKCPVVIRVPIGGYLTGGSIYHSQSGESIFTHCPGLRVVMPSTALDVAGLLRTSIRCDDPVIFLEHKHLYRQPYNRSEYPGPDYMIPFGQARLVKEGSNASIITYGALVHRAEVAAAKLEREGISVEIIDLRSLSPYDWDSIAASVRKTHRVIVAYEDMFSWGYGAEIAARIGEELFSDLDAPVKRVAAMDSFCAYQPQLEDIILPQTEHLVAAVKQITEY